MNRNPRHPRSYWEKLVAEVEAGIPAFTVARRHGVHARTLGWWRTQLRRAAPTSVRLVPVVAPSGHVSGRHIEISLGAAALRIEEGTDVDYVAAVVRALTRTC